VYDVNSILILWFAGASAMAGLLNLVPRFLPKLGMAPQWTIYTRPLVLVITGVCFGITWFFGGSVEEQAGPYATGVLAFILSGALAATFTLWFEHRRKSAAYFGLVSLILMFTFVVNVSERPDGLEISAAFICAIILLSAASRYFRDDELRVTKVKFVRENYHVTDDEQKDSRRKTARPGLHLPNLLNGSEVVSVVMVRPKTAGLHTPDYYAAKIRELAKRHHLPRKHPILIVEFFAKDAHEFMGEVEVIVHPMRLSLNAMGPDFIRAGEHNADCRGGERTVWIMRARTHHIANAMAALLLKLSDLGYQTHANFGMPEGNLFSYTLNSLITGEGATPSKVFNILRWVKRRKESGQPHINGAPLPGNLDKWPLLHITG
jgi:hypothetical protein